MSLKAFTLGLGPIGYWRLNATAGAYSDLGSGGHDGTALNLTRGVSPLVRDGGKAALFDNSGPESSISLPDNSGPAWLPTEDISYACWFKPASVTGFQFILDWAAGTSGVASNQTGCALYADGTSLVAVIYLTDGATYNGNVTMTATDALAIGRTFHAAVTFDASAGVGRLHVNGKQVATDSDFADIDVEYAGAYNNNEVHFGYYTRSGFASLAFNGVIDEVSLYDKPLTASNVAVLYRKGKGQFIRNRFAGNRRRAAQQLRAA